MKKPTKYLLIITAVIFLISCKKDELKLNAEILVGTWNWSHTDKVTNKCDVDSLWNYSIVDSSVSGNEFSVEFYRKGKVSFYHNGGELWKQRIVFQTKDNSAEDPYSLRFVIRLNNNRRDLLHGFVGEDSLLLYDFPLDTDAECEEYFNYFVRA